MTYSQQFSHSLSLHTAPFSLCSPGLGTRLAAKRKQREKQKTLADDYAQRLATLQKERAEARASRNRSSSRKSRRSERK